MNGEYLTEIELAERLRRSAQTIARWRKAGKAPRSRRIGGRILYQIDDVRAWETQQAGDAGVAAEVQAELDRYAKQLGLNMATSEGIQRLGRAVSAATTALRNEREGDGSGFVARGPVATELQAGSDVDLGVA